MLIIELGHGMLNSPIVPDGDVTWAVEIGELAFITAGTQYGPIDKQGIEGGVGNIDRLAMRGKIKLHHKALPPLALIPKLAIDDSTALLVFHQG